MENRVIFSGVLWSNEQETASVRVYFGIKGDGVVPDIISNVLNISPSRAFAKGEPFRTKTRDLETIDPETGEMVPVWRSRYTGIWVFDTIDVDALKEVLDVNQHIKFILDFLEPHKDFLKKFIDDKENYLVSFTIEWYPTPQYLGCFRSFTLDSELMVRMGNLSNIIVIDIAVPKPPTWENESENE